MTKPPQTLQMPSPPDPVPVVLNPATTALLIFDIVDPICSRQPNCTGKMVPAIASLLARARQAGVTVVYGTRAPTMSNWLPEVSPTPGDIKIKKPGAGQVLQHRSRQNAEGQRHYDAHSGRLEGERIGDLHFCRGNAARLHGRRSR